MTPLRLRALGSMLAASLLFIPGHASAHVTSTGLATLDLREATAQYSLSLPLDELNESARATLARAAAGEQPAAAEVATWLRERVTLSMGGHACPWARIRLQASHIDPTRVGVLAEARCPVGAPDAQMRDQLSAQFGEHYRSIVSVTDASGMRSEHVLDDKTPLAAVHAGQRPQWGALTMLGNEHILGGSDHLLFVVVLVLGAIGGAAASGWLLFGRIAMQVTAFTLAHSFSLALATLGWVRISGRIVEPLIAASIVWVALAAWQSMRARRSRPRAAWHQALVAFLFGLVHGLAFAEALTPLHLDGAALAWALLAFNLGVEIGQLLVVVVTVPALLALRRTSAGSQALPWFALGAAAAGGFWLVQRLLGE